MSLNHAKSARRLARYLLLFEIFINAVQFGLIFVAIGHDANATTECNLANIGTSTCLLPQNGCDGILRGYGRCEFGTIGFTIAQGQVSTTAPVTFTTPFTNTPETVDLQFGNPNLNGFTALVGYYPFASNETNWAMPSNLLEFLSVNGGTTDMTHRIFIRSPVSLANTNTAAFFSVFVVTAGPAGSTLLFQCGVGNNPSSWTNMTSIAVSSGAGTFKLGSATYPAACETAIQNANVRLMGFGGDNVTKAQFGTIGMSLTRTVAIVPVGGITLLSTTGFTLNVAVSNAAFGSVVGTYTWKAFSESG